MKLFASRGFALEKYIQGNAIMAPWGRQLTCALVAFPKASCAPDN